MFGLFKKEVIKKERLTLQELQALLKEKEIQINKAYNLYLMHNSDHTIYEYDTIDVSNIKTKEEYKEKLAKIKEGYDTYIEQKELFLSRTREKEVLVSRIKSLLNST